MIAGNDECILVNGHRYLGQTQLFVEFNKIVYEKWGISDYFKAEFHEKEITLAEVREILSEVCERLYENLWNDIKKNFGQS